MLILGKQINIKVKGIMLLQKEGSAQIYSDERQGYKQVAGDACSTKSNKERFLFPVTARLFLFFRNHKC